jgi:transketolase
MTLEEMKDVCQQVRADIALAQSQAVHPGSLSCVEIFSTLYLQAMKHESVDRIDRDRFVLSKGHCACIFDAVLANRGFFLPVFASSSLEQGAAAAVGLALESHLQGTNQRVFAVVGDSEMQETQYWEAMMSASQHRLSNLTVIIDHNDEVGNLGSIPLKMESFGFYVIELNGHDIEQLMAAYSVETSQPKCIIANTSKDNGASFKIKRVGWPGKTVSPDDTRQLA